MDSLVKDPEIRGTTARINPATKLRKKLGKQLENTTTINLIESLSIIQRTQPKPLDNNTFRYYQQHYIN
ncbi:hypothetical protein G9A89_018856 [Geosiphon pyriformis]|nr:hypothetical protein G9A89_018856 [Geosiphon pyriformis]